MIIRIERLTAPDQSTLGHWAFETLRYLPDGSEQPDFVFNQPRYRGAPILLAGPNFGCGSSREGAVTAIQQDGRGCISPELRRHLLQQLLPERGAGDPAARNRHRRAGGPRRHADFEDGSDIGAFMAVFAANRGALATYPVQAVMRRFWRAAKRVHQANPERAARANARHHYDLSAEFYRLFLDEGLSYSCAVFENPETDTLEQAQRNKLDRIAAKLRLGPGMTVAEIGSGWGSLAIHLAATAGARVTAINVSPEQIAVARQRAAEAGVADLVTFREIDYRRLEGRFDRVVSGRHDGACRHRSLRRLLRQDPRPADPGRLRPRALHRPNAPAGSTAPFIRKYIFPGAYVPSLSEVFAATERTALWVADMEVLRLHYHHTLHALAPALRGQPRARRRTLRRALLPHVGILPGRRRRRLLEWHQHGFPAPALEPDRRGADPARERPQPA